MAREGFSLIKVLYAAIFIALEIAALGMLGNSSSLQDIWINRSSRRVQALLWGSGENVRNHFNLQKQNAELAEANFLLNEKLRKIESRFKEASDSGITIVRSGKYSYIPASIVKMSRNTAHNYIIIDKGSDDGITPLSGIISDRGVVGIISAVDRKYSYGLTLMNANTCVSARIGETGLAGPLVWDGHSFNGAVLKDIPMHHGITPGDTVLTSGYSSIFPPDIPVGIAEDSHVSDGSSFHVAVRLFEDFSSLRYVTVVRNNNRNLIEDIEKRGNEEFEQ